MSKVLIVLFAGTMLLACENVGEDLRKICGAAERAVQGGGDSNGAFASQLGGIKLGEKTQQMVKAVAVADPASKYDMMLKFARDNGEGFWSCPALKEKIWAPEPGKNDD